MEASKTVYTMVFRVFSSGYTVKIRLRRTLFRSRARICHFNPQADGWPTDQETEGYQAWFLKPGSLRSLLPFQSLQRSWPYSVMSKSTMRLGALFFAESTACSTKR